MRQYHRWIAPVFAIIFLWIAVTGITIQVIKLQMPPRPGPEEASLSLIPTAQAHEHDEAARPKPAAIVPGPVPATAAAAAAAPAAAAAKSPAELERARLHDLSEFVMDLHSGKVLGPIGTWLSILSGLMLLFLAFSGLWMYIQMFRRRAHRASHPRQLFW